MISIHDSKTVEFSSSKFINNSNIDIFRVLSSTLFFIDSCLFVNNYGRVFDIRHTNDVFLQRSSFINPDSSDGSTDDVNNLRIFKCFSSLRLSVSRAKTFVLDSDVSIEGSDPAMVIEGSPYASVEMVSCGNGNEQSCLCFYDIITRLNIQNCSSSKLQNLPLTVPDFTDWLILDNNHVRNLNRFHTNLQTIRFLNLTGNKISSIATSFLGNLSESKSLKWLDLSNNDLKRLPPEVQELTNVEKIWLGDNPFHCDCDMTWMIGWNNNFTTGIYRKHVVTDHAKLKCHTGNMRGKPIYKLKEVDLGCYPHDWTLQQKLIMGLSISIGTIIIVAMVIIGLYSRRGRFLLYYYLKMDTIPRDDKDEDLENIEYDAFFCYRSVRAILVAYVPFQPILILKNHKIMLQEFFPPTESCGKIMHNALHHIMAIFYCICSQGVPI